MPETSTCPACGKAIAVPEGADGRLIRCGQCRRTHRITRNGDRVALVADDPSTPDTRRPIDSPEARSRHERTTRAASSSIDTLERQFAQAVACRKCGTRVPGGDVFCSSCGTNVRMQAMSDTLRRAHTRKRYDPHAKTVRRAGNWILAVGILYLLVGAVQTAATMRKADDSRASLARYGDEKVILFDGESMTAGDARDLAESEVIIVVAVHGGLGLLMIGLSIWARSAPTPAILTALCVFLGLNILAALSDPSSLSKGLLVKFLCISALVAGLRASLAARAAGAGAETSA